MAFPESGFFRSAQVLPGVYHILDPMNVCCTLLVGQNHALLFDTGYGLFDLAGYIQTVTALPLTVLLSHGHHDHACGAFQFEEVFLSESELGVLSIYTGPDKRRRVLLMAEAKGLLPAGYDQEAYLSAGPGNLHVLQEDAISLGGMTVQVLHTPGHTRGSLSLFVKDRGLLLTGDNWNLTTWIFFPECERIPVYVDTMNTLVKIPFDAVLAPHETALLPGEKLRNYVRGLNGKDAFDNAWPEPVKNYEHINTYACRPGRDTTLFFDRDKLL